MTFQRFLILLLVPLLVAFPNFVAASSPARDPILVANGDFEQRFVAVTVGGQEGQIGDGWIPFVLSGSARFSAGQIQPPLNHWQVIHASTGPYSAGVLQQLTGLRMGERLRAEAHIYLPEQVDGIAKVIGLDPMGGHDPAAPTIVWSAGGEGSPWQTIAVTATMATTQTTVFVRVTQPDQTPPAYVFVDNISVERVGFEQKVYLPTILASRPPEPAGWQYGVDGMITGSPSCSSTGMRGVIRNEGGAPQSDVRVRVWSTAASGQPSFVSLPTGSDGRWEIVLDPSQPLAGRWYVAIVNQSLQPISPVVGQVAYADVAANPETRGIPTHGDCTNGHQWLTINFQRRGEFPLYTLASVRFLSCMENHMDHDLRLWVITVDGQGIRDLPVRFQEAGGFVDELFTGRDPFKPPGYIDYPIYSRQNWTTRVVEPTSDATPVMSSETPLVIDTCSGYAWGHFSYEIVFQRRP